MFHVNYNTFPENWDIEKLIGMCVQEEDRLRNANGGELVFAVQQNKKNYQNKRPFLPSKHQKESGPSKPPQHNIQKIGKNFQLKKINALSANKERTTRGIVPSF